MGAALSAAWTLGQEARALRIRLARLQPFALLEPMLPAAAVSVDAMTAIEQVLLRDRRKLDDEIVAYLEWLNTTEDRASPEEMHRRYVVLRTEFNVVIANFDLFSDVLAQRSENQNGVWLAGLDAAAEDLLAIIQNYVRTPAIVCRLGRGPGGAIRRAGTRLSGRATNPVAVIHVPRERMVGAGLASSLAHEVGHQGSALLELAPSVKPVLRKMQKNVRRMRVSWTLWERWISEILADLWAIARIGVVSTLGLMGVVSIPRAFQFHIAIDDPHPTPFVRVKLSAAIGSALYPHTQWSELSSLWDSFYPRIGLTRNVRRVLEQLEETIPALAAMLVHHRPRALRGRSIAEVLATADRTPRALTAHFRRWAARPGGIREGPPSLVLAAIGQARRDGHLSPDEESTNLENLLSSWALERSMKSSADCARRRTACFWRKS